MVSRKLGRGSAVKAAPLVSPPLGDRAALVVVDMQRLFADHPDWGFAALHDIVPRIRRLALHRPDSVLFSRFIPVESGDRAKGNWRRYYARWPDVTLDRLDPAMIEILPSLADLAHRAEVHDKLTLSCFGSDSFRASLYRRSTDTLILAGVEADACVLATAIAAVDLGYRIVMVSDAMTGSVPESLDVLFRVLLPRFDQQIDTATTDQVIAAWPVAKR